MARPSKRPRFDGESYTFSLDDQSEQYSHVYAREFQRKVFGSLLVTTSSTREVQKAEGRWKQATNWMPVDNEDFALDNDDQLYEQAVDAPIMEEVAPPQRRQRSKLSKRPHVVWKEVYRSTYLDEIVRFSGRGEFTSSQCSDCLARKVDKPGSPAYRCIECLVPDLCCKDCCVRRHRTQPLHRIEMWQGSHFEKVTLQSLGLKVQLNHTGSYCENAVPCHSAMIVVHTNGLHEVSFNYCGCTRSIPQHIQLLRRGFYPASQQIVQTCATFSVLDLLHKFAVTSKGSTYDFYRALDMLTNNTGVGGFPSRYRSLFRMVMQWRHLKLLKRGGRGHDPTGPDGTSPGELAIQCPSCPYPGINLPDDWEEAPPEMQFLYMVFACMDANFRLKNQLVSNYSQDPGLGIGMAYMAPREPYESYVLGRASDADISTCVGLQALAKANTRFSKGLRYTGVGGVFCGRSEMVLPNSIGNLQKGERYANMDFIFALAIGSFSVPAIVIGYDIACQWFINLEKRMSEHWPENIRLPPSTKLTPAIPKLHEPMHGQKNHERYSLNLIPGVGNSDLENSERFWAGHNPLGNATKTQGPGSRQDVLDDHFSAWNWMKYTGIGLYLMRKFRTAVGDRNIQAEAHRGLTETVGREAANRWETMCVEWEKDKTKKNPYETESLALTEAQVKKELAADEEKRLNAGGVSFHSTTASAFVSMALDLEDTQRRLRRLAKNALIKSTARQGGSLTEQRNQMTARIRLWEQLLPIYMPGLLQYQTNNHSETSSVPEYPEDRTIWLPSRISESARYRVCTPNLAQIEEKLRTAQCYDSLEHIRHILKIKTRFVKFKNKNIRGQRYSTRSRAIIDRVHDRARFAAEKYRWARSAKVQLTGSGNWENELRKLDDADIRGYQDPSLLRQKHGRRGTLEDGQDVLLEEVNEPSQTDTFTLFPAERTKRDGTGETRKVLSWIWLSPGNSENPTQEKDDPEAGGDEVLRAEWAKSRARVNRTREEVQLVREEMRRTLESLEYRAKWWISRAGLRTVDKTLAEALKAEAEVQANVQRSLASRFRSIWKDPLAISDSSTAPISTTAPPAAADTSSNQDSQMMEDTEAATSGSHGAQDSNVDDEDYEEYEDYRDEDEEQDLEDYGDDEYDFEEEV